MPHFARPLTVVALTLAVLASTGCSKKSERQPEAENTLLAIVGPTSASEVLNATVQLPAVPGRPAVAYFTLFPASAAKGSLVSVSVAHFARAEMHESKMEGGAMTMTPVDNLPLTPDKAIVFAPAGLHVMLFDPDNGIKPGDTTDLTATLSDGTKITAKAKVTAQGEGAMQM